MLVASLVISIVSMVISVLAMNIAVRNPEVHVYHEQDENKSLSR